MPYQENGGHPNMNFSRAIVVHVLAASLLLVGVCPCSLPTARGSVGAKGSNLAGCGQASGCQSQNPAGKTCCCCSRDGKRCGAACCCQQTSNQKPAAPANPSQDSSQDQEQVVCAFVDLPALLTAYDAAALLRASSVAGHGFLSVSTLQSQSVRIQT